MLYNHFNENLLGLQDVEIEKIEEINNIIHIYCKLTRKTQKCPDCSQLTNTIHDYKEQISKDSLTAIACHLILFHFFGYPNY